MLSENTLHKRRLLKLARHLLYGKLAHEKFDFSLWNHVPFDVVGKTDNICGTAGCAIGECPAVFPETFCWRRNNVVTKDGKWGAFGKIVMADDEDECAGVPFFGLSKQESCGLFLPANNTDNTENSPRWNATRYDVGNHILKFVVKKYGKIRLTLADKNCKELVNPNENVVTA